MGFLMRSDEFVAINVAVVGRVMDFHATTPRRAVLPWFDFSDSSRRQKKSISDPAEIKNGERLAVVLS
jgi:hypothetical protein